MTKEEKSEYDRKYREKNKELLKTKKKRFNESPRGRELQKQHRIRNKEYLNEYNKLPEQREKERIRRHIRENKLGEKICIICNKNKSILEFEFWGISEDNRSYLCKECEKDHQKNLGCTTRNVITAIVMRPYTKLTRSDVIKYPYLIEANKYLILLKKITK